MKSELMRVQTLIFLQIFILLYIASQPVLKSVPCLTMSFLLYFYSLQLSLKITMENTVSETFSIKAWHINSPYQSLLFLLILLWRIFLYQDSITCLRDYFLIFRGEACVEFWAHGTWKSVLKTLPLFKTKMYIF